MKKSCQSPTLQEIIDLIGEAEAIKLVSQLGGVTYYFPLDGAENQHVSINPKAWQALCKYFGGFNMPEFTAELLRQAIESGEEIEALPFQTEPNRDQAQNQQAKKRPR